MDSLKSSIKTYKKALSAEDKEVIKKSLSDAYKALDKASKTNLIKKNKARRLKSRLAKKQSATA
jgi:ribosomal protein S20